MPEKVPGLTANRPETYYDAYFGEELEVLNTLYEKINGVYELTTDTEYDSNKTYYKQYNNGSLINIYSDNFYDAPYYGFTRLGLQADFKAWLREYNCIQGDYGLKMTVDFVADERVETNENGEEVKTIDVARRILYLSCADMVGNPYQFESFYTQEKVFDITDYGGIAAISIDFYQQPGSFKMNKKDDEDNFMSVPYMDELGNHLLSNLFVQNWDIIIGYDIGSYDTDVAKLYSLQKDTYSTIEDEKTIELKWVHIDDEGRQIVMNQYVKNYDYEIRWYRYLLGEPSADNYCGSGWTDVDAAINENNIQRTNDPYKIILKPDAQKLATESIKAIILFGKAPGYEVISITEEDFISSPGKYYHKDNDDYINCLDISWDTIKDKQLFIKEIDNRQVYKTQILEFKNLEDVLSAGTIDALSALTLTCFDKIDNKLYGTQGNYLIYNQGNQLIDYGQSAITRGVRCKFNLVSTEDDDTETLNRAEAVTWIFPLKNTMIIPQIPVYGGDTGIEYMEVNENLTETTEKPIYGILKYNNAAIRAQMTVENNLYASPYFLYKIGTYFAPSKLNNYIQCIVEKDGVSYRTAKDLTFGQAGSAGTEYTFVLELEKNINALTAGKEQSVKITGLLYDSTGKEQDLTGKTIEWGFVNPADTSSDVLPALTGLLLENGDDNTSKKLHATTSLDINTMCIIRATLIDWGDYKLTTFLPVPIRNSDEHICISGATSIVYLTDGSPQYYNSNYQFHTTSTDELVKNPSWQAIYGSADVVPGSNLISYFPSLSERESGTYLQPVSMFVKGLPMFAVQAYGGDDSTIYWTQPILMVENRYPSAMVNEWDGKELIINDKKNAILSKMIGAGRKEEDNSFSGVLMGDWVDEVQTDATTIADKTGLFGFNHGEMSFSLTDDGLAKIGKASSGQIVIDGNESLITSGAYLNTNGETGMAINLADSTIVANQKNGNGAIVSMFELNGQGVKYNKVASDFNKEQYDADKTLYYYPDYILGGWTQCKTTDEYDSLKEYYTRDDVPIFRINDYSTNKTLMNVGKDNYYLESANYVRNDTSEELLYKHILIGSTRKSNTKNRWKNLYGDIFYKHTDDNNNTTFIKETTFDNTTYRAYYKLEKMESDEGEKTINGSRFDLNDGEIEFNRGYINGDIILQAPGGLEYTRWDLYGNTGTATILSASLSSILSELMSTVSRVEYLANYAIDIATTANSAATKADNAITRLENFFDINTNATASVGTNITMRNYYEVDGKSGYGNGSVRVGNAVTIRGNDQPASFDEGDDPYHYPGILLDSNYITIKGTESTYFSGPIRLLPETEKEAGVYGYDLPTTNLFKGRLFFQLVT